MTFSSKMVKTIAASTIAASSFVAINPFQAEAATSAESLVKKAESNSVILNRAISVDYKANAVTQPWAEYNQAKKDYDAAKAAVAKLSGSQKTAMSARLDKVKVWIDRTAVYIDSISSGKILLAAKAKMEQNLAAGNMEEATKAYHALSYEIKKQAAYLYKVYGQSTRAAILAKYKAPAEVAKQKALYPVSIHLELNKLELAVEAENNAAVNKSINLIEAWLYELDVEEEQPFSTLVDRFITIAESYVPVVDSVAFSGTEMFADIYNAFEVVSFFDKDGIELYVDSANYNYIIKDDKGFFNEDGSLKPAYEEDLLPQGNVKLQLFDGATNTLIEEKTFTVVEPEYEY